MKITIITDSSSDITKEEEKKLGLRVLNMSMSFGGIEYIDRESINVEEFYNKLEKCNLSKELPKTSAINSYRWKEVFEDEIKKGNYVLCLPIAHAISATYEQAMRAKEEVGSDKVAVIDSESTTIALRAIILELGKYIKNNKPSFAQVQEEARHLIKNFRLIASFESLKYLKAGGRLSGTAAFMGTLLNVKPIIEILNHGHIVPTAKCLGMQKAYQFMIKRLESEKIDRTRDIYIAHAGNSIMLQIGGDMLKKSFGENTTFISGVVGPVVGTHIGRHCLAYVYFLK